MNTPTASTSKPAARLIVSGRVEHIDVRGDFLVVCRAGCFMQTAVCPAVEGIELGDEVELELAADLRSGRILEPKPLPPFRPTKARR